MYNNNDITCFEIFIISIGNLKISEVILFTKFSKNFINIFPILNNLKFYEILLFISKWKKV